MNSLGEVVNNAMELVEAQSEQLIGVLPKDYTMFSDELLVELLRIFNNSALDEVGGDVIGRIYEYFLNKFAKNIAQDDGVFFTPERGQGSRREDPRGAEAHGRLLPVQACPDGRK